MSETAITNDPNPEAEAEHGDGHGAHPKPKYDDVNIPVVVLIGILSAILTFVSIAFVQGLYFSWTESMVQADWNNRNLTPQEQAIVDQKQIRDGFYETKEGKIYVSVEVAARKMMGADTPKQEQNENGSKPEPPGPETAGKAEKGESDPKKEDTTPNSNQKKESESKTPVTKGDTKTGDNK